MSPIQYLKKDKDPTLVIHLRLPSGLSDQIRDFADRHGVSINRAVVSLLLQALGTSGWKGKH